ncbi:MAG: hypothetical protein JXB45_02330 [Candidatus Krumholzibacteriota bacterium]|nr:hypothetical protein [Candidatus Krumholzibacteriota bacterium]
MSRILGMVEWGGGRSAGERLRRLAGEIPPPKGGEAEIRVVDCAEAALGLVAGVHSYTCGIAEVDQGRYLISLCGFFYALEEVFRRNDLSPDASPEENLVALYRLKGESFLELLPGMFSLAIYDRDNKTLLAAGDRSGFFPIYYTQQADRFVFCSSIKPVISSLKEKRMNAAAVCQHLFFDSQYGRETYYQEVENLNYGGYLLLDIDQKKLRTGRYFRYQDLFDADEYQRNRRLDAPRELTEHLKSSLRHIVAGKDPRTFGLLCGGGIDCSFTGGLLREIGFAVPIFCFYVSDVRVSELDQARELARRLGTELITSHMPREQYYPLLLRNYLDLDQPVVHPNMTRFYIGAQTIREQGRPNQLLGVASDLLFGGTGNVRSLYRYNKLRKLFRILPARARRLLAAAVEEEQKINLELRMRNSLPALASLGMGNFERAVTQRGIEESLAGIPDRDERAVKTLMLENLCDYQQHLLNRRYELTSGEGLSYYFPFLDIEMIRFAINLPVDFCVDWRTSKAVVRKAAYPYLGSLIANRPKWGGDIPIDKYVVPMKFLLPGGFVEDNLRFSSEELMPVAGKYPKLLWNLIDIELWGRICMRGESPESLLGKMREQGIECLPHLLE